MTFFDPIDIQVPLNNAPGIYVNMETGAFGNSVGSVTGWDINIFNRSAVYLQTYVPNALTGVIGYTLGAYDYANRLSADATIGLLVRSFRRRHDHELCRGGRAVDGNRERLPGGDVPTRG